MRSPITALSLLVLTGPALAYDDTRPIWDQVDTLYCKGTTITECRNLKCRLQPSKADWRVDFKGNVIEYLSMPSKPFSEPILSKSFQFFERGSSHSVALQGRVLVFDVGEANRLKNPYLVARLADPPTPRLDNKGRFLEFRCGPKAMSDPSGSDSRD